MNMDRFKFRVWVEGVLGYMQYSDVAVVDDGVLVSGELFSLPNDSVTLMQCTGLKDSEGKLVFEGDVLVWTNEGEIHNTIGGLNRKLVVVWDDDVASFCLRGHNDFDADLIKEMRVLGNIYSNPELLEGER